MGFLKSILKLTDKLGTHFDRLGHLSTSVYRRFTKVGAMLIYRNLDCAYLVCHCHNLALPEMRNLIEAIASEVVVLCQLTFVNRGVVNWL